MSNKHNANKAHETAKNIAPVETPTPEPVETPTPAPITKLEQLQQASLDVQAKIAGGTLKPGSKEFFEAVGEMQKIEKDIAAERNEIARREAEIAAKAQRSERIALREKLVLSVRALVADEAVYAAVAEVEIDGIMVKPFAAREAYDAVYHAYEEACVPVDNALLGALALRPKIASTATATATATATDTVSAPKGDKTKAIMDYYIAGMNGGTDSDTDKRLRKELIAQGYNDGTVGNTLIAYRRSIGVAK